MGKPILSFKEWIKQEMAGTTAIVSCKDRNSPDFQVWGVMSDLKCRSGKSRKPVSRK